MDEATATFQAQEDAIFGTRDLDDGADLFAQLGNGRGFNVSIEIQDKNARLLCLCFVFFSLFLCFFSGFQGFFIEQGFVEEVLLFFVVFVQRADFEFVFVIIVIPLGGGNAKDG